MINLTEEERLRFAAYCRQEAESAGELANQAMKLPATGTTMGRMLRVEAAAFTIIAKKLATTEVFELKPEDLPPGLNS